MDVRFRSVESQQATYPSNDRSTGSYRSQPQNFLRGGERYLNNGASQVLQLFRNAGRSYQSFARQLSEQGNRAVRQTNDSFSILDSTSDVIQRVKPDQRMTGLGHFATTAMRTVSNVGNAVVGVGDALVAFADDYDSGNETYSGFMRQVPKITGQLVALGGTGALAGAALGVSMPVLGTVALGAAAAWGVGQLFDALF